MKTRFLSLFKNNIGIIISKETFQGQTLCIRTMLTAFMDDATNIISFFADGDEEDDVGYSIEWSIFKPKRSGQQVVL